MAKDKRRSIKTKIWSKPWVENLEPKYKLLWIYLLTNSHTNLLGLYEVSTSRMSFEIGLDKETINTAFEHFAKLKRAYRIDSYVILPTFLQNQKMNDNMWKHAISEYNSLSKRLKDEYKSKAPNSIENLRKHAKKLDGYQINGDSSAEKGNNIPDKYYDLSLEFHKKQKANGMSHSDFNKTLSKDTKVVKQGAKEINDLVEIDGESFDSIKKTLDWGLQDSFWQKRVVSLANIRKKSKNNDIKKYFNVKNDMTGGKPNTYSEDKVNEMLRTDEYEIDDFEQLENGRYKLIV